MSASLSTPSNTTSKRADEPSSSKRRWSQEEKQQRKAQKAAKDEQQQQPKPQREKKLKSVFYFPDRLVECATKAAASTTGVYVKPGNDNDDVRVVTTSNSTSMLPSKDQEQSSSTIIMVKPLLILDLNGILCYRIRYGRDLYPEVPFRASADYIANTPIIPRIQVDSFLQYLDAHFCLAVWTSAKPNTAKLLLKILFPESIRLLFVWTQHQCQSIPNPEGNGKPIFVKSLKKVWEQYPLWNATNTLLVDDSPEKCPDINNTLHPPPLNGKQQQQQAISSSGHSSITTTIPPFLLSDEENEAHQLQFFSLVVQQHFWVARETWPKQEQNALSDFLNRTAASHMGWRGTTA